MAACISRLISTVISTRITTIYRVYRKYDINTNDIVCVVKIRITTLQRVARCLVFCVVFCRSLSFWPFSFDHWVVCPSPIYGFWLSLWYHELFLNIMGVSYNYWKNGKVIGLPCPDGRFLNIQCMSYSSIKRILPVGRLNMSLFPQWRHVKSWGFFLIRLGGIVNEYKTNVCYAINKDWLALLWKCVIGGKQ
jgi:hypothetical protein